MKRPADVIRDVDRDEQVDPLYSVGARLSEAIIVALKAGGWAIVPASQTDYGSHE